MERVALARRKQRICAETGEPYITPHKNGYVFHYETFSKVFDTMKKAIEYRNRFMECLDENLV
jgi:hypothetical protein